MNIVPDPAALLSAAMSLRLACEDEADTKRISLSDCYSGGDEFLRQCMKVATVFETWACTHVDFPEVSDVWPYLLDDTFGPVFVKEFGVEYLTHFNEADCLTVAQAMNLPLFGVEGALVARL